MAPPLEVATDEVDAMARAAREIIDARLQACSQEAANDFWLAVQKLYVRGSGVSPLILEEPATTTTSLKAHTEREAPPASPASPVL